VSGEQESLATLPDIHALKSFSNLQFCWTLLCKLNRETDVDGGRIDGRELNTTIDRRDGLAVNYTQGFINNQSGEEIARVAYKLIDEGYKVLLFNLTGTKIVNSSGISVLIELIEKMIDIDGRLGLCCLTPTIEKTFRIMGLAQYGPIFPDEADAVAGLRT